MSSETTWVSFIISMRYELAGLKRRMNPWQGVHFQCCCPPGHKTVHFFFVNYVSSPPGLSYHFFLHFFFLTGLEHLPAMIVFIAHLNLKSSSKWFSSLTLHSSWFCVICPECRCSSTKRQFFLMQWQWMSCKKCFWMDLAIVEVEGRPVDYCISNRCSLGKDRKSFLLWREFWAVHYPCPLTSL